MISFLVVIEVLVPNQVKRVLAEVAFFVTWDARNRNARTHLIATQIKEGCAAGSWPASGHTAGPVMATSIHALALEVYYHYLPLYQLDNKKQDIRTDEWFGASVSQSTI